jgi:hypothetical protein
VYVALRGPTRLATLATLSIASARQSGQMTSLSTFCARKRCAVCGSRSFRGRAKRTIVWHSPRARLVRTVHACAHYERIGCSRACPCHSRHCERALSSWLCRERTNSCRERTDSARRWLCHKGQEGAQASEASCCEKGQEGAQASEASCCENA